jgi:hypothetical protein
VSIKKDKTKTEKRRNEITAEGNMNVLKPRFINVSADADSR